MKPHALSKRASVAKGYVCVRVCVCALLKATGYSQRHTSTLAFEAHCEREVRHRPHLNSQAGFWVVAQRLPAPQTRQQCAKRDKR